MAWSNAPKRFETPDVSRAEIDFGIWFKKLYRRQLMPDDDWFDPMTKTLFEIKDVSYPLEHFGNDGQIRMNKVSVENHIGIGRRPCSKVVVAVKFSCGTWLFSKVEEIVKVATEERFTHFADRPTLFVPISVFKRRLEDV